MQEPPAGRRAQNPFQQAGFDIVLLDMNGLEAAFRAQVLTSPTEVFSRLHAVRLIRRVRFRDEVRYRCRYLGESATHFLADPANGFGHFDDTVEIDRSFAGQAAQEVEFHPFPAVLERFAATFEEIFILDLLANLFAHIVARTSGAKVRPPRRTPCMSFGSDRS